MTLPALSEVPSLFSTIQLKDSNAIVIALPKVYFQSLKNDEKIADIAALKSCLDLVCSGDAIIDLMDVIKNLYTEDRKSFVVTKKINNIMREICFCVVEEAKDTYPLNSALQLAASALAQNIGGSLYGTFGLVDHKSISVIAKDAETALYIAYGLAQKSYKYNKSTGETKEKKDQKVEVAILAESFIQEKVIARYNAELQAIFLTCDLVNSPANLLNPESYSLLLKEICEENELDCRILDSKSLEQIGARLLLGVGKGSVVDTKMVVLEHRGRNDEKYDIVLVGKGVTFDTGGSCLKPSRYMYDMKTDMAGSAVVFAVCLLAKKLALPINIVAIGGLVENNIGTEALYPGDVVKSMAGKTVEILDTDAEGRLVLADLLHYAEKTYQPKYIVDLATLTGSIVSALGAKLAGLYSNDAILQEHLLACGAKAGERLWAMPLLPDYQDELKSSVADIKNCTKNGQGDTAVAAQFLSNFIIKTSSWAHLDIAGVASESSHSETIDKEASGFGVKLLSEMLQIIVAGK